MKKEKYKLVIATMCLLVAVSFAGCLSPEEKSQIATWWDTSVTKMTCGDIFIVTLLGSVVGGLFSK